MCFIRDETSSRNGCTEARADFPVLLSSSRPIGTGDRGIHLSSNVLDTVHRAPHLGYPFGNPKLVGLRHLDQVLGDLQQRGMVTEGSVGLEITHDGKKVRYEVTFKPREGVLSRLLNRISVTLSLKDLWPK
jgi:hypothetical protein